MKNSLIISIIALPMLFACNEQPKRLAYPETSTVDTVDVYFGTEVPDPYRWLEDANSEATKQWVEAQNAVTNDFLAQIPFRNAIKERLSEVWNYATQSVPQKKGDKLFYYRHDGKQNHAVLYVKSIKDSIEKVLIDPNLFSEDGTVSLGSASISPDGKYVAYEKSSGGSDWREVFVRDVETGTDLDDHLKWVKFSALAWDAEGFYYSRYDEPKAGSELSGSNQYQKLFYHKLNTTQAEDKLIYEDKDNPSYMFSGETDDEFNYLFLYVSSSTNGNRLLIKDLKKNSDWKLADPDFDTATGFVGKSRGKILVLTNTDAPRYRLMAIDPANPAVENWKEVIPESDGVLSGVALSKDYIIANYMVDVQSRIKLFNHRGEFIRDLEMPGIATISGITVPKGENRFYFNYTSYTTPSRILIYDIESGELTEDFEPKVDFNPEDYEVKMVFIDAEDGAKVPISIVYKKDIVLDGTNPTLLYGYGGFNVVYPPRFDARLVPWLENGGIYVNAHIRGGGEYGDEWYKAGTKLSKKRVFEDFIIAARYLIDNQYTSSEKLAIYGGSNGGLLVGAVANMEPGLFKVALPAVGVMDMLRYHLFTIGWAWAGDYGRSDDSEEMFGYLYSYSPLHNIPKGDIFPATLVTTADHDDRVVPAHSFKYIAQLQKNYSGNNPVLIRIDTRAGHGAGKPLSMQIEEVADRWAFTLYNMGETYGK